MKKIYSLLLAFLAVGLGASAQIFTTSPLILQESSKDVVLYYHADQGNAALKGTPSSTAMYCHIGAITTKSGGSWSHVIADWGKTSDKTKMKFESTDVWSLTVGDLRTYFGITDPDEHITRIAILPWINAGATAGRTAAGGDIYIDVAEDGFAMIMSCDPAVTAITKATSFTFNIQATEPSTITLFRNGTQVATVSNATTLERKVTVNTKGAFEFVATANNGTTTISKSTTILYVTASPQQNYPGGVPKMGAVKNADGTVTFCIAAPNKESVTIVPSWDDYKILDSNLMKYQDYNGYRYFWITVSGLKDNEYYPYYYLVDGTYKVADPYARLVLDYMSDKWDEDLLDESFPDRPKYPYDRFDDAMLAVYRGDMDGTYKFDNFTIPDHNNLIIYEMLLRDFTGDEGEANAMGNIKKAIQKIEYLHGLGVNCIELMPVMEFSGNKSWGYNPNFYFALDKAYGSPKDLKDFVKYAHNCGMAVILDVAFNHSDGLHPWYAMYSSSPFYNAVAPHDWSVFNDWKQEHPLVRQQFKDAIKYWMTEYNIDGFRFDLVKGLGYNYGSDRGGTSYNAGRVEVMKDLQSAIKEVKPNGIHINEAFTNQREENELAGVGQLGWQNVNSQSNNYVKNTSADLTGFSATSWGYTSMKRVSYAESHDEQRMAYEGRNLNQGVMLNRLGQVAVQMLLTPGPKMIWQFGELGDGQNNKNGSDNNTDPKVVNWSYLDDANRKGLFETYQALCYFRTHNPSLFSSETNMTHSNVNTSSDGGRYMKVTSGDLEVVAIINPSKTASKSITVPQTKINRNNYQVVAYSKNFTSTPTLSNTGNQISAFSVPANGYVVFATANAAGVNDVIADSPASKVQVFGGVGEVLINGEYDTVAVYDLSGRTHGTTGLTAGVYIVKVDNETFKVKVQ